MAEDAVNAAIKSGKLSPSNPCVTHNLRILGGDGWESSSFTVISQQYVRMKKSYGGKTVPAVMDTAAAKHLSHAYGTRAEWVANIAQVGLSYFEPQLSVLHIIFFPIFSNKITFRFLFHFLCKSRKGHNIDDDHAV